MQVEVMKCPCWKCLIEGKLQFLRVKALNGNVIEVLSRQKSTSATKQSKKHDILCREKY